MAELSDLNTTDAATRFEPIPVREHLRAIAWLRWRLFVNKLSGKGGELSFLAKFIAMPFQALFVLMIFTGCAFAAWFMASDNHLPQIAFLLWAIAIGSQFIPIVTAASAPPFDFASLIRFPFRYSGYLALRLFYGLLDSHAVIANFAVLGVFLGMLVGDASLALRALPALALFAAANFLFTRMVLAWIDRWLAQRKTREILGVFVVLLSLGFQVAVQAPRYIRHARLSSADHPLLLHAWDILQKIGAFLPPSIAGRSIVQSAYGSSASVLGNDALLFVFAALFALLLHRRLFAEYRGENLNEAPALTKPKLKPAAASAPAPATASLSIPAATGTDNGRRFGLSRVTLAVIDKEIRLLLRGSAKIQQLASPLMIAVILVFRSRAAGGISSFTWPMLCGYTLYFLTVLLNNSLGSEGAGINFYFLAPVRIREIMLGKNIVNLGIYVIEIGLVYGIVLLFGAPPSPRNMIFTMSWAVFALAVTFTVGNLLSLYSPRKYEVGKMRRQAMSGLATFATFAVLITLAAIGFGVHMLTAAFRMPYLPEATFATLTVIAGAAYVITLNRLDQIAFNRREQISAEICKP